MTTLGWFCPGCWIPVTEDHKPWRCDFVRSLIPQDILEILRSDAVKQKLPGFHCDFILWKAKYLKVEKGIDGRCIYCLCPYWNDEFHEYQDCKFSFNFAILLLRLIHDKHWLSEFSRSLGLRASSFTRDDWLKWLQVEEYDGIMRGLLLVVPWVYERKFKPYMDGIRMSMMQAGTRIEGPLAMLYNGKI